MGRDFVYACSRMSVHYYIWRRRMIHIGALINVWPLICSKIAENSWKLDIVDKTRCIPVPFKPKTGMIWGWPIAGLLACDLYFVLECTLFWHQSAQVYLFFAKTLFVMLIQDCACVPAVAVTLAPGRGEGVEMLLGRWYRCKQLLSWVLRTKTMSSVGKSTAQMLRDAEEGMKSQLRGIITRYYNWSTSM